MNASEPTFQITGVMPQRDHILPRRSRRIEKNCKYVTPVDSCLNTQSLPESQEVVDSEHFHVDNNFNITISEAKTFKLNKPNKKQKKKRSIEVKSLEPVVAQESEGEIVSDGANVVNDNATEIHSNNEASKKKCTRHRKQTKSSWPREIAKYNRERGKAFKGYSKTDKGMVQGVERPERQLGPRCLSKFCLTSKKRNCHGVSEIQRVANFNRFWDGMNWDQKKVYIASLVDVGETERKTVKESRRSASSMYFLKINNKRVQVCKGFFLSSFGLNERMVSDWSTNNDNGMIPSKATLNARRKATRPPSQKSLADKEKKDFLLKFFDDLPKMPSHYCRSRTDRQYIEPNFQSLAEVYRYYQILCTEFDKGSLSYGFLCDLFKDQKLSLYQPKKDRCDTCEGHDKGNVDTKEYDEHVLLKDRAREEKERDKNRALAGEIHSFVWDVEAVKLCPVCKASALFFKLKLKVHNFSIYDLCTKDCVNNWWHEGEGGMDASIFTTCAMDFLNENCNDDLPIVVWSDGCGYQNRNQILSNALLDYAIRSNKNVQQKFLVKGHTQMEVDSVHALIENKLKGRNIYLPTDYITATEEARQTLPLRAKLYHHQDFRNYDDSRLFRYNSIRPGKNTGDDTVQDLRVLEYSPNGVISFKTNFDDPLQPLPHKPKKPTVSYDQLEPLYTEEIKISAKRYKDLQDLKVVLSKNSHIFYDQLKHED